MSETINMEEIWRDHPHEGFFVSEAMVAQVFDYIVQKARAGCTTTKKEIMEALAFSFMAVNEAVNILISEGTVCTVPSPSSPSSPDYLPTEHPLT